MAGCVRPLDFTGAEQHLQRWREEGGCIRFAELSFTMSCPRDSSRTDESGRAFAGSQRQVQTFVNERTRELNRAISDALREYFVVPDSIH